MTEIVVTPPTTLSITATSPNSYTITAAQPASITVTAAVGNVGDMTKAVYDTDNDGVVDNSEALGGVAASGYVQSASVNYVDLTDGGLTTLHAHYSYYTLQWSQAGGWSVLANTTYYLGGKLVQDGNAARARLYFPVAGTIIAADFCSYVGTTLASAETSSAWIRISNTTDTLISDQIQQDAIWERFVNSSLSIAVTTSDYFEIKWTTPAWSTTPTNTRQYGIITVRV